MNSASENRRRKELSDILKDMGYEERTTLFNFSNKKKYGKKGIQIEYTADDNLEWEHGFLLGMERFYSIKITSDSPEKSLEEKENMKARLEKNNIKYSFLEE